LKTEQIKPSCQRHETKRNETKLLSNERTKVNKPKPSWQAAVPGGRGAVGQVPGGGEIHLVQVDVPAREEALLVTLSKQATLSNGASVISSVTLTGKITTGLADVMSTDNALLC
jgi:hypothetical protein